MVIIPQTRSARDSARLKAARREVLRLGLRDTAEAFVRMIMSAFAHYRNKPWRHYLSLSEQYGCPLPQIDGMHLYLRERSAHQPRPLPPPPPPPMALLAPTAFPQAPAAGMTTMTMDPDNDLLAHWDLDSLDLDSLDLDFH
jgi:hypothetical protein